DRARGGRRAGPVRVPGKHRHQVTALVLPACPVEGPLGVQHDMAGQAAERPVQADQAACEPGDRDRGQPDREIRQETVDHDPPHWGENPPKCTTSRDARQRPTRGSDRGTRVDHRSMVLPRRPPSPRLTIASFTERGPHPENEDAFEVSRHPADPSTVLCVLADGQGGRRGGARAARLACAVARDAAAAPPPRRLLSPRVWRRIARRVDASVARDPHAGLTTFVGLVIRGARLVGGANGDSAGGGGAGRCGGPGPRARAELPAGQRKPPPVGSGNAALVPFSASLSEPWSVVAMSDGVWHRSGRQAMLDRVATQQGEALIRALTAAARTAGHDHYPDDVTVVVVDGAGDRKR